MEGKQLENDHVHKVYDEIASHFSLTRYKPWPVISNFLNSIPKGSIVGDIGCGNGKYMVVNKENIYYAGCDRSIGLLCHAKTLQPHAEFCLADNISLPYRNNSFDYLISIAVIHHFSTFERRVDAVKEILRVLRRGGKVLIFVWAFEQTEGSKRKFAEQDVFVSWKKKVENKEQETADQVLYRYYHVFKKGELEKVVEATFSDSPGSRIIETGYDKDNWFVVVQK